MKENNHAEFFNKELKANTYKGLYAMHKYWAKKPYNIISEYIKEFTKEGDMVFDPYCGSGVVVTESLLLNRKVIGNDLNPVATFITKKTTMPINIDLFEQEFLRLKEAVQRIIYELYTIPCPTCKALVIITHSIWHKDEPKRMWFTCDKCQEKYDIPVSQEFIDKITEVNNREIPYWYPDVDMIENSRINVKKGQKIKDLFTHRNLIATSILFNSIQTLIKDSKIKNMFEFVFTSAVPQMTKLMFVIKRKKRKGSDELKGELGSWVAGYWMPNDRFELNAWNFFVNRYNKIKKGKVDSSKITKYQEGKNVFYFNDSSLSLKSIEDNSVDYIFTDPPYADMVPYFEQSLLWGSWLKKQIDFENEIVISNSPSRNKNKTEYIRMLAESFMVISKKLKDNKYMTITFNNLDHDIWEGVLKGIKNANFELIDIRSINASAASVIQDSRNGALKGDLYLTFKKGKIENHTLDKFLTNGTLKEQIEEVILKQGGATFNEVFTELFPIMIKQNKFSPENNIQRVLKEEFILKENKWHIKD